MGQDWVLLNLDKREMHGSGSWGKLGEFLFDGFSLNRLSKSLMAYPNPTRDSVVYSIKPGELVTPSTSYKRRWPLKAVSRSKPNTLIHLPVELICEIYSHLNRRLDVVCLAATCQHMWEVGRPAVYRHIMDRYRASIVSWPGDRIMCMGNYLETEDIPAEVLTHDERKELLDYAPQDQCVPYTYVHNEYYGTKEHYFHTWTFTRSESASARRLTYEDESALHDLLHVPAQEPVPLHSPVLRNISRKYYVRWSAVQGLKKAYKPHKDIFSRVGFGEVLITRICLSSDPSSAIPYNGPLHRGAWAGHCFDIVSASEMDNETWLDVSDEVLKDVEDIWRADYHVKDDVPRVYSL
ncbi:hypothetical protein R3P38DRAFT_3262657 [Favolaschia claudopus]|uniref:F-box domain-containing protein n=1 Tax=Favolaschia claudopus TaxID=2862362 RepID=A0AAW0CGM3_9AGAR